MMDGKSLIKYLQRVGVPSTTIGLINNILEEFAPQINVPVEGVILFWTDEDRVVNQFWVSTYYPHRYLHPGNSAKYVTDLVFVSTEAKIPHNNITNLVFSKRIGTWFLDTADFLNHIVSVSDMGSHYFVTFDAMHPVGITMLAEKMHTYLKAVRQLFTTKGITTLFAPASWRKRISHYPIDPYRRLFYV